jgi:hypothetical protein
MDNKTDKVILQLSLTAAQREEIKINADKDCMPVSEYIGVKLDKWIQENPDAIDTSNNENIQDYFLQIRCTPETRKAYYSLMGKMLKEIGVL